MRDTPTMLHTDTEGQKQPKKLKHATEGEYPVAGHIRANDSGNAKRLVKLCGYDILFVKEAEEWFVWNGARWVHDVGHVEMLKRAKAVAETIYAEALEQETEEGRNSLLRFAMQTGQQSRLKAMIESARSEARVVGRSDFDQNHWLFNCQNGTLDLCTGELKPHNRNDLITKISPVTFDPMAKAPRFERFMMEVMQDDVDKVKFLQRALGYSLTGDTSEECFFVLWGAGRNGKGKLKDTFNYILGVGQYAQPAQFDTFVAKKGDEGKPNDVAALFGARFVSASEGEHSKRLAEAKIKLMTGRDPVIGEHKYERSFSYVPTYKIWLLTNPKPRIVGTDEAIWDRIYLVPFLRYFAPHERDGRLLDKLIAEAPGILNWLVEGCLAWQREGLNAPACIRAATKQYKDEQNVLGHFIEECCEKRAAFTTGKTPMYDAYRRWAEKNGEFVMTNTEFSDKFSLVFEQGRSGAKGRYWKGVALKFEASVEDLENPSLTPEPLERGIHVCN